MAATTATASESVDRLPGERLVRAGGVIGGLGALAALLVLAQLVFPDLKLPPIMWFVAIGGVGVGVGLALFGVLRSARARRSIVAARGTSTGR
ncbi:MAG: hypothetical protein QG597_863 [Actinomycetota bacterium]|nr:hypothetical protein [Actinomycetota bacterium]